MSRRFREGYGAPPVHLLCGLTALALSGYAILELFHRAKPLEIAEWLIAAILIHDFVLLPVYSLLGGLAHRGLAVGKAGREERREALNHLRIAVFFVVLPLFIWAPLIFGLANARYLHNTGQSTDIYLGRWLLYTGVICAGSTLLYVVRVRRMRARLGRDPAPVPESQPAPDAVVEPRPAPDAVVEPRLAPDAVVEPRPASGSDPGS